MSRDPAIPLRVLTGREWEIVAALANGWSNKRIAAYLRKDDGSALAVRTVEAHIENIAAALPNPERLSARTLVMLFARDLNRAA